MLRVKKLIFNDGTSVEVNNNDIIVFVGPNNSGKSQALKDIFNLIGHESKGVVVTHVEPEKGSVNDLIEILEKNAQKKINEKSTEYSFLGQSISTAWIESYKNGRAYDGIFRRLYFSILNTDQRLSLSDPPSIINYDEAPQHPIHLIKKDGELRKKLSSFFSRAFGSDLIPGSDSREIPLFIGDQIAFDDKTDIFKNEQDRLEEYQKRLRKYPQVHLQGDGIRSFTGILLNMLMPTFNTFLIDEPESFLHPPQARILGESISEILPDDKQIFISTHSQDLLKGLLDGNAKRVKIIRITRDGNINMIRHLENKDIAGVWSNSLLRHSDILDSLFHTNTVVCESDSDCKLYSIILDYLKQAFNQSNNTLFIHCGGKERYQYVIHTLRLLGIDYRALPDIDFLDDRKRVRGLVEECGGDWKIFEHDYDTIVTEITKHDGKVNINNLEKQFSEYLNNLKKSGKTELEKKDIVNLRAMTKEPKGWKKLKKGGFDGIPAIKDNLEAMDNELRKLNIVLVPVGELESFLPDVGAHGPTWVSKALEKYPDLNDVAYNNVKSFISSLSL